MPAVTAKIVPIDVYSPLTTLAGVMLVSFPLNLNKLYVVHSLLSLTQARTDQPDFCPVQNSGISGGRLAASSPASRAEKYGLRTTRYEGGRSGVEYGLSLLVLTITLVIVT